MFTNVPTQQQESRSNAAAIAGTKQAKQLPAVPVITQLQQAHIIPVLQMVLDEGNVKDKANTFLKHHGEEKVLIIAANDLLTAYSQKSSHENFMKLNDKLPGLRDEINKVTNLMADIIGEYAGCKEKKIRTAFLNTVLAKDNEIMGPLFDKLIDQTVLGDNVDEKFKNRFLSYTLQSITFKTGQGRVKELMGLLGDRTIKINTLEMGGPKAGQANPDEDNPKSEKTDERDKDADKELLKDVGGNLAEFVKAKQNLKDERKENPKKNEIGNLQIFMDSSDKLLPVYYGLKKNEEVNAYASPMFTAVHHELGHMTNALKGKHGKKSDKYTGNEGVLAGLTDEEELQNISLDKFSDKAFTDELGLPERIAHTSLGGLDKGSENDKLNEVLLASDMQLWDKRTYGRKKYYDLIKMIKTIADAGWGKHTNWGSKPSGVKTIANEVKEINGKKDDIIKQLTTIKKHAITSKNEKSSDRAEVTKKFYEALADMEFDSEETIIKTRTELVKVWELV